MKSREKTGKALNHEGTGMFPAMCGPAQYHRAIGRLPEEVGGFPADLREAGHYTSNDVKTDYNSRLPLQSLWNHDGNHPMKRNRNI